MPRPWQALILLRTKISEPGLCPASTTASPGARQRATNASTRGFSSLRMASRTRIPSRICGILLNHNVVELREGRDREISPIPGNRLLTRAAPCGAATVTERFPAGAHRHAPETQSTRYGCVYTIESYMEPG